MLIHEAPNLPPRFLNSVKAKSGNWPNDGRQIGPCWRAMWAAMTDAPGPIWLEHVGRIGAAAGACSPETSWMLLYRFRRAGVLVSQKELIRSRWRLVYTIRELDKIDEARVTPEWLAEWCEKSGNPRLQGIEFP